MGKPDTSYQFCGAVDIRLTLFLFTLSQDNGSYTFNVWFRVLSVRHASRLEQF